MSKEYITYTDGWKYQLRADYTCDTDILPLSRVVTEYLILETDGRLTIKRGYAWDGPSGPTVDTKSFMRGSLVHDACYQLLREKHLPRSARDSADRLLQKICKEDGMSAIRAWWVYQGVAIFGKDSAGRDGIHKTLYAPKKQTKTDEVPQLDIDKQSLDSDTSRT
jgi:hypothetical protein